MPAETLEAPSAATSAPPSPPPPTSEIHVTPATVQDKGPAQSAPKKGSAMESMFQDLRKKAGANEESPTKPAATPKTQAKPLDDTPPDTTITDESAVPADKSSTIPATTTEDRKKVSPWKLVDQYKNRVSELEKSVADAKTTGLAETEKKALTERLTRAEQALKEYEEEIRFTNYSKSQEFRDKYQKPYEESWTKWMGELGELLVETPDGGSRPLAPNDILELVNMPLQKAREAANQVFGDFADDVMSARKEIRSLFDAQSKALDEARKSGAERDQKRTQDFQAQQEGMKKQITELWTRTNDEILKDEKFGAYFRPVEGDQDGNTRLQKGYDLADKAFQLNSFDPRLTPEQRAYIVKVHAAVRNRCAAFGRLTYQNQKLQSELESLKSDLSKFKGAQPGSGEGVRTSSSQPHHGSAMEGMMADLRKLAH